MITRCASMAALPLDLTTEPRTTKVLVHCSLIFGSGSSQHEITMSAIGFNCSVVNFTGQLLREFMMNSNKAMRPWGGVFLLRICSLKSSKKDSKDRQCCSIEFKVVMRGSHSFFSLHFRMIAWLILLASPANSLRRPTGKMRKKREID